MLTDERMNELRGLHDAINRLFHGGVLDYQVVRHRNKLSFDLNGTVPVHLLVELARMCDARLDQVFVWACGSGPSCDGDPMSVVEVCYG